jgi:hypothetical protein
LRDDPDWPRLVSITPGLTGYVEAEAEDFLRRRAEHHLPRPAKAAERARQQRKRRAERRVAEPRA